MTFLVLFGVLSSLCAQNPTTSPEYKLKAVFLFNFIQFVDWPPSAFSDEESPIILGILGPDPFGESLEKVVQGEIVKGRKIQIRHYKTVDELNGCHVLFISSETAKLNSILASLKGRSILTVGEGEGFSVNGGIIRFITEKNKIRFRINVEAAKAANLSISSKLLQLSEIVPEKRP